MSNTLNADSTTGGQLIPLDEAVPGVPYRTIFGWTRDGVDGVRLKSLKIGRYLRTHPAWIAEFLVKVNARRPMPTRF
jgi:hypothetical protein